MERKHWSPDHPAVMAWRQQSHYHELSLAERRRAVIARSGGNANGRVRHEALTGLVMVLASGFVFDHAETAGGDWWMLCGLLLGGGGALVVDAIRRAAE
jgi:hypothetical protein